MINPTTLDNWASKSLEERVRLFKRRYPESKITVYKLRKLYSKHKIRNKCIKYGKVPRVASLMDIVMQAVDLSQEVQDGVDRRFRIIQLDECVVTKKTAPKHAWTLPKTNITLDQT